MVPLQANCFLMTFKIFLRSNFVGIPATVVRVFLPLRLRAGVSVFVLSGTNSTQGRGDQSSAYRKGLLTVEFVYGCLGYGCQPAVAKQHVSGGELTVLVLALLRLCCILVLGIRKGI